MEEESLVSEEAVRSLYDLYSQDIYRYAWYNLGNSSQAEDVVQEVFLRAFRSWRDFRSESAAKTWLMSIAKNYLYDVFRKKQTESRAFENYVPEIINESISVETIMQLKSALLKLKKDYRQIIVLRYIEELSVRETGQILGWTESKVGSTTHRAIKKLRETFDGGGEDK